MNLIIDQGNTGTKLAIFNRENKLIEKVVFPKNEQEITENWIASKEETIKKVLISSVTNQTLRIQQVNKIYLSENTNLPIKLAYKTPNTLGKDRIANAVAIWQKNKKKNSLCIDIGTCIKYDLVNHDGVYLGGNISPGMKMRYAALNHYTAKLPIVKPIDFEYDYGKTTNESILNGVQQAIYHEINGFIERYTEQFQQLTIFMTGGDLKYFDKAYKNPIFADSDLTIFGLNEILKYNVEH